jgi:hypothetical protein
MAIPSKGQGRSSKSVKVHQSHRAPSWSRFTEVASSSKIEIRVSTCSKRHKTMSKTNSESTINQIHGNKLKSTWQSRKRSRGDAPSWSRFTEVASLTKIEIEVSTLFETTQNYEQDNNQPNAQKQA